VGGQQKKGGGSMKFCPFVVLVGELKLAII